MTKEHAVESGPPVEHARDRRWHRALMAAVRFRAWLLGGVFTSGALAIILRADGHLLMVKPHYRAGWGFPGGFMQHKEQPADALTRELWEEIGLSVRPGPPLAVYVQPGRRHIDHLYVVSVDDDVAIGRVARTEIANVRWFAPSALPAMQPEARIAYERFRGTSPAADPDNAMSA